MRAQAVDLIRQARANLQAGHFEDATKKAQKARQLNVVFGMFEDRPDTVLADIARARSGPRPDLRHPAQCPGQLGPIDLLREVEPDAGGPGRVRRTCCSRPARYLRAGRIDAAQKERSKLAR